MKNSLEGFNGRFEQAEKRISELEDRIMEIIKTERQKEKRWKKSEQDLRDSIKGPTYILWESQRERRRQREIGDGARVGGDRDRDIDRQRKRAR